MHEKNLHQENKINVTQKITVYLVAFISHYQIQIQITFIQTIRMIFHCDNDIIIAYNLCWTKLKFAVAAMTFAGWPRVVLSSCAITVVAIMASYILGWCNCCCIVTAGRIWMIVFIYMWTKTAFTIFFWICDVDSEFEVRIKHCWLRPSVDVRTNYNEKNPWG